MKLKIWKIKYDFFEFSPDVSVSTEIEVQEKDIIDLGKGFKGVYLTHNDKGYVFELKSGGHIGKSIDEVKTDIAGCDDINMMKCQVESALKQRDKTKEVSNHYFWNGYEDN